MHRLALFSLALLASAACNDKDAVVRGDGFSAPIPPGYSEVSKDTLARVGQAAAALTKPKTGTHFRSSIAIAESGSTGFKPGDLQQCAQIAAGTTQATGATLKLAAEVVEYPFGPTCHFAMADAEHYALFTIAYVGDKSWAVTCSMDPALIKTGTEECKHLLRGFGK